MSRRDKKVPEDLEAMTLAELYALQEKRTTEHMTVFQALVDERDRAQKAVTDYVERGQDVSRAILQKMIAGQKIANS